MHKRPRPSVLPTALALVALAAVGVAQAAVTSVERASVSSAEAQANGQSLIGALSDTGRFVAFSSAATNLVAGDTNGKADIFVRDRQMGTTERVSVGVGGAQNTADSFDPAISGDGRMVAFYSTGNLTGGASNRRHVFVHDRTTHLTSLVSQSTAGVEGNSGSHSPALSETGRFIAFASGASVLVTGDTNNSKDIFVRDRDVDADGIFDEPNVDGAPPSVGTVRVNVTTAGVQADQADGVGGGYECDISSDGRFVAFHTSAKNLVPDDGNNTFDVFVRDRDTDENGTFDEVGAVSTERVSLSNTGNQATSGCQYPSISDDGRWVVFGSHDAGLVADDTNSTQDIFVRDRELGQTRRVSVKSNGEEGNIFSYRGVISGDGSSVAFGSDANNLVADDTNATDVFVHLLQTGETERVSISAAAGQGNGRSGDSFDPVSISANGRVIAYYSRASNLVSGDTNNAKDIFVAEFTPGALSRPPVANAGPDQSVTVPHDGNPTTNTARVTLDGRGSSDPDGPDDIVQYLWKNAAGAQIGTQTAVNPVDLTAGTHQITLRVTDSDGLFDEDEVRVIVAAEPNRAPVANAGADQNVTIPHDGDPNTSTVRVTLDGRTSADPDGDTLAYEWLNALGSSVGASSTIARDLPSGASRFTLRVTDPYGATTQDTVLVTVAREPNRAPVANAGADQNVTIPHDGDPNTSTVRVTLDGRTSADPDGDTLAYEWLNALGSSVGASSTIARDLPSGASRFTLRVTDPYGATTQDTVLVTVAREPNRAPVANAGADQNIPLGRQADEVVLDGSASTDPDGDALTYSWKEGNQEIATGETPTVAFAVGRHAVKLVVTDPYGIPSVVDETIVTIEESLPGDFPLEAEGLSSTQIRLAWQDPSPNELRFEVQRSSDEGTSWQNIGRVGRAQGTGDALRFVDRRVEAPVRPPNARTAAAPPGGAYWYRVRVIEPPRRSRTSAVAIRVPLAAPSRLRVEDWASVTRTSFPLTWQNNSYGDTAVDVEVAGGRKPDVRPFAGSHLVRADIRNLTADTAYTFRVRTRNSGGVSSWSDPLNVVTPPAIGTLRGMVEPDFVTLEVDLGDVRRGRAVTASVLVGNRGRSILRLWRNAPTPSREPGADPRETAGFSATPLASAAPRGRADILIPPVGPRVTLGTVTLSAGENAPLGPIQGEWAIYTNDADHPVVVVRLKGNVLPSP